MFNYKVMVAGAVSGFVSAFVVDLHAWSSGQGGFNFKKAAARWAAGAVSGAMASVGLGSVTA